MTTTLHPRSTDPNAFNTRYRSSLLRMAISSVFWVGLTALSALFLAAIGMMTTTVG